MTTPRRVGLFGGSFNPPHICHALASSWAIQMAELDEVWWIPTFRHAFDKPLAPYDDRVAMCEAITARLKGARVSRIEEELGGVSRTIRTVRALAERYARDSFSLLIGADILAETDSWASWDELIGLVDLLVVGRQGAPDDERAPTLALPEVSSRRLRRAWRDGERELIEAWVPRAVRRYAEERALYAEPER